MGRAVYSDNLLIVDPYSVTIGRADMEFVGTSWQIMEGYAVVLGVYPTAVAVGEAVGVGDGYITIVVECGKFYGYIRVGGVKGNLRGTFKYYMWRVGTTLEVISMEIENSTCGCEKDFVIWKYEGVRLCKGEVIGEGTAYVINE